MKVFKSEGASDGNRTIAGMLHQKALRNGLEDFWNDMRRSRMLALQRVGQTPQEVRASVEIISATTTPDYEKKVAEEEQRLLAELESFRGTTAEPAQKEWGESQTTVTATPSKRKDKTRPIEPAGNVQDQAEELASLSINTPEPTTTRVEVKKRAFAMLKCMYPTTETDATKSFDWDTFVHAMADMGFCARNGGGSAVVFENQNASETFAKGKIIFHKPHPVPKIDPVMLHSWGRRMTKWFGWHEELFMLES